MDEELMRTSNKFYGKTLEIVFACQIEEGDSIPMSGVWEFLRVKSIKRNIDKYERLEFECDNGKSYKLFKMDYVTREKSSCVPPKS